MRQDQNIFLVFPSFFFLSFIWGKRGIRRLHILCTSLSAVIATGEWCLLWGSLDVRHIFNPNALCYLESPWCCCTLRCLRLCLTLKKGRRLGPSGLHFWISRAHKAFEAMLTVLLLSSPQVAACQKNKMWDFGQLSTLGMRMWRWVSLCLHLMLPSSRTLSSAC